MAAKRWYQDYRIVVALIGLIGTVATLVLTQGKAPDEGDAPAETPAAVLPGAVNSASTPTPVPTPVLPSYEVAVNVMDEVTGDRIGSARLVADEQGISTETDAQGRCTVPIKPGLKTLRITVSREGYQTKNVELSVYEGMPAARIQLRAQS